ncbi:hypothetical protein HMPREF0183_1969 [Brevibacterium mcbrellneri ATCC 49030]|uniref:Uncharacterized protein n=1 Tax=Brevibacterium mcbrellneri ATCC 49030 TaxID=585530 RepID=D4YPV9_9MICO|nr:hypothetical protein HMPREF0183_1969 [Brevibacterium mcbrellneri ATCC 49030]
MKTTAPEDPRTRARRIALIAGGLAALLLVATGLYGLILGPEPPEDTTSVPRPVVTSPADPSPTPGDLATIPASEDPEEFARTVVETLFAWDTASGFMPLDYSAIILDVGDPSGTEQAGLASDVAAYLPSSEAWSDLRQYATHQHLSITTAYVPDAWDDALAQAQPGQLPEGATAITIEGTRHRAGVWNGEEVTSEHAVSFTIFRSAHPPTPTPPTPPARPRRRAREAVMWRGCPSWTTPCGEPVWSRSCSSSPSRSCCCPRCWAWSVSRC